MKTAKLIIDGKEISVQIEETELKKLEVKKDRWRAEENKGYFTLWTDGAIGGHTENGSNYDDFRHLLGNYFKTKEQVESYKQFLQAVGEIKQYITDNGMEFVPDWGDDQQYKYFIFYNYIDKAFQWVSATYSCYQIILPYLSNREHCRKVISDCHKQLEIIREYSKDNNY